MKRIVRLTLLVSLSGLAALSAQAAFSSLHIYGDTVSSTTNNTTGGPFWGNRWSNGRVWVEVLAQRLGLPNNTITNVNWSYSSNNWSYYGHTSTNLVAELSTNAAPADASTALFVVWVNDADFTLDVLGFYLSVGTDLPTWNSYINSSLTNQFQAITKLYAQGVRALLMPNAVDITEVPGYSGASDRSFIRGRVVYFNTAFTAMLNQARASLPGLRIYSPDFFTLLDNMVTNVASYGFINVTSDALDSNLDDLDGTGTNYLFWDYQDPSAMAHEVMADVALQLISPVTISSLATLNGSNQLTVANLPIGLSGFVDGTTNLASGSWTSLANFNSASATQTIFVTVPVSAVPDDGPPLPPGGGGTGTNSAVFGPSQFYRLRFPFAWTWP